LFAEVHLDVDGDVEGGRVREGRRDRTSAVT